MEDKSIWSYMCVFDGANMGCGCPRYTCLTFEAWSTRRWAVVDRSLPVWRKFQHGRFRGTRRRFRGTRRRLSVVLVHARHYVVIVVRPAACGQFSAQKSLMEQQCTYAMLVRLLWTSLSGVYSGSVDVVKPCSCRCEVELTSGQNQ